VDGEVLFTGARNFTVKEIEVFHVRGLSVKGAAPETSPPPPEPSSPAPKESSSAPEKSSPASPGGAPSSAKSASAPSGFTSAIVDRFPALFADLAGNPINLLWRGSRDGFAGTTFHGRCDGHPNTLTLIEDTNGNIFGGFAPLTWDALAGQKPGSARPKADPTLGAFLFTLVNPHKLPPTKFPLIAAMKDSAIMCVCERGPAFGTSLVINDDCTSPDTNLSVLAVRRTWFENPTKIAGRAF
jgi:hypothetical protein